MTIAVFYVAVQLKWRRDSGMPKVTHDIWAAIGVPDEAAALAKFDRDQRQLYLRSAKSVSVLLVSKSYGSCKGAVRKENGSFPERHVVQPTPGQQTIVPGYRSEQDVEAEDVVVVLDKPKVRKPRAR